MDQNNEEYKLPNVLRRIELSKFSAISIYFVRFRKDYAYRKYNDGQLEENLDYTISQPYYINLITHILICIKRFKRKAIK